MLSPTGFPDPDPRPVHLTRVPRCARRASAACRLTWHWLPTPTATSGTAELWPIPVAVRLTWTARNPCAVTMSFRTGTGTGTGPVVWTVGRELLAAGVLAPAGLGDLTVLPDPTDPALAELVLSTPSGRACFRFLIAPVAGFLDRLPDPPEISPAVTTLVAALARHGDTAWGEAA